MINSVFGFCRLHSTEGFILDQKGADYSCQGGPHFPCCAPSTIITHVDSLTKMTSVVTVPMSINNPSNSSRTLYLVVNILLHCIRYRDRKLGVWSGQQKTVLMGNPGLKMLFLKKEKRVYIFTNDKNKCVLLKAFEKKWQAP